MDLTVEAESTLTERFQTTVPEVVRKALRLRKRDKIRYEVKDGEVVIRRAEAAGEDADPVMGQFLSFLAEDIASHPERVQAMDRTFVERLRANVSGVAVDLDVALSPEDE